MVLALFAIIDWNLRADSVVTWAIGLFLVYILRPLAGVIFEMHETIGRHDGMLGAEKEQTGFYGRILHLEYEARQIREWSIEASAELDIRRPGGRS